MTDIANVVQASFLLDDELVVEDEAHECIDGYLWATDALCVKLNNVIGAEAAGQMFHSDDTPNFYVSYNIREKAVQLDATYWIPLESTTGRQETHHVQNLPLSVEEQTQLISAVEAYCRKEYGCDCLTFLNNERKYLGLPQVTQPTISHMSSALSFKNAQEMYDFITKEVPNYSGDIYNRTLKQYAFLYNATGSICVYSGLDIEEAMWLAKKARESDEYWGAFLGYSGSAIYDTPDYDGPLPPETNEALEWCEDVFHHPSWQRCEDFAHEVLDVPSLDHVIGEAFSRIAEQPVSVSQKIIERI